MNIENWLNKQNYYGDEQDNDELDNPTL